MSYYSSACLEADLPGHICDPCNTNREYGRVRSVALIAKSYLATLLAAPIDPTVWQTGIDSGDIIIIPETSGSFDPGDPKEEKGYGDTAVSYGPRTQTLTYFDPNYRSNYAFYNAMTNITSKVVAFRTSSVVNIADVTTAITAKNTVADDLEAEVGWEVKCVFKSVNLPQLHDASALGNIFKCNVFIA